jgi:hypothetical protein
MIYCPKCGEENQVGSIFCSACSSKIDLDAVTPQQIEVTVKVEEKKPFWSKLFGLVLLCIGGWCFWSAMQRPSFVEPAAVTGKQHLQKLAVVKDPDRTEAVAFSAAEMTAIARDMLGFATEGPRDAETVLWPENIYINFLPNKKVKIVMHSRFLESIDFYTTVIGTPRADGNGLDLVVDKVLAGRLSIPSFGHGLVIERYTRLTHNSKKFKHAAHWPKSARVADGQAWLSSAPGK